MGVVNITPNSFSDGGEIQRVDQFNQRLVKFREVDCIDLGAESTAPMNQPISSDEEWERFIPFLSAIKKIPSAVSIDTYHPETIEKISKLWIDEKIKTPLIWNDISGKFDQSVRAFLNFNENFYYIYCHNLAPTRQLSGSHMDYMSTLKGGAFLDELADFFMPYRHGRVIFDPCLGFSKNYEQNWYILDHFSELQSKVDHWNWVIGFSRKSFLRKKFNIDQLDSISKEKLDFIHKDVLDKIVPGLKGSVWIRTHRPELL